MSDAEGRGPIERKQIEITGKRRANLLCEVHEKSCPHAEP